MRLKGGRTGKRAVVCDDLELTGLMRPFDLEVWYGERVAVLGSNGSGKSHFLRLLAAGGSDPDVEHQPVGDSRSSRCRTRQGQARRPGPAGLVRADPRAPRAGRAHAAGDPAPRRGRRPRRDGPRAGRPGARPLRAGPRRRAAVRVAQRRAAGAFPDPAARAVGRDAAAPRRADRQPRRPVRRGARGRGSRRSTAPCSRSPTTAGSPAASTASWSTAPTARSTSPTGRCGTRAGWCGRDERPRDRRPRPLRRVGLRRVARRLPPRPAGDGAAADAVAARGAARDDAAAGHARRPAGCSGLGRRRRGRRSAFIRTPLLDNLELAELDVHVAPAHRRPRATARRCSRTPRRGRARARPHGRSTAGGRWAWDAGPVGDGAPGARFARAAGYALALSEVQRELGAAGGRRRARRSGGRGGARPRRRTS